MKNTVPSPSSQPSTTKSVGRDATTERKFQVPRTSTSDERRIKDLREWEERSEHGLMGFRSRT